MRSRRGSYFVEASLIYPVSIVITVMLIAAAMYFYSLTASCSDAGRTVRRLAGEESGTVYYSRDTGSIRSGIQGKKESGILSGRFHASYGQTFVNQILFPLSANGSYEAESPILCEAEHIWKRQVAEHAAEDIAGTG